MKRVHSKLLTTLLLIGAMTVGTLPVFAQNLGVKLNSKTTSGNVELEVALDTIPQGVKGIEIHLPMMTKVEVEKENWASSIKPGDVQMAKVLGDEQTVALYVVSDIDFTQLEDKNLVTLNLKVEGNIEGIKGQDIHIKYVDKDAKEVVTTAKADLTVETENGDGSNNGGNNNGGNNNGGSGNGGSSNGGNNNNSSDDTDDNNSSNDKDEDKEQDKDQDKEQDKDNQEEVIDVKFSDMNNHWAADSVKRMASKGILKGYEDGSFKPNNPITRGEITAVLSRAFDLNSTATSSPFKDVEAGKWYTSYVQAMYENGITTGRPDGTFGVKDFITNEDFAVMLSRTLKAKGVKLEVIRPEYKPFEDEAQISGYAQDAIKELYQLGILNGADGKISPKAVTTRAQVATMIDRILQ